MFGPPSTAMALQRHRSFRIPFHDPTCSRARLCAADSRSRQCPRVCTRRVGLRRRSRRCQARSRPCPPRAVGSRRDRPVTHHHQDRRRPAGNIADRVGQRRRRPVLLVAWGPGGHRSRRRARRARATAGSCRHQPRSRRSRHARPDGDRHGLAVDHRAPRRHRPERRRRDDRFRRQCVARGSRSTRRPFRGFRQRPVLGVRRLRPRNARRGHHRRQRPRSERRASRARAWRTSGRAQGPRRLRHGLYEQRHRRHRLRDCESRRVQHPRAQPLGRRWRLRVLHQGPADPRRQTRGRLRHRRRRRRRQPWARCGGPAAVRRHHFTGQCAVGSHRRRDERSRHSRTRRRRRRGVQLARTGADRRQRQAGYRRSRRQHRVDG